MPALIRIVSVVTIGIAVWLASVVAFVLPAHDPTSMGLWTIVAIWAGGFGVLSLVITDSRAWRRTVAVVLSIVAALLAVAALFLGSVMITAAGAHPEGYLVAAGLVFVTHGSLVIVWLGARMVTVLNKPSDKPRVRKWY